MIRFPYCKINIGLHITGKRPDGYHNIETLFYPVTGLNDIIEIVFAMDGEFRFTTSGFKIPGEQEDNLCCKTFHLLQKKFDLTPVHAHLHKRIPIGSGLGGGSSNAAAMICMVDEMFGLEIPENEKAEIAATLGSDCPFFLQSKPAYGKGKGEIIEPVDIELHGYHILIVKPAIHSDTAEAYAIVESEERLLPLEDIKSKPPGSWKDFVVNDFEKVIFQKYPEIKTIKDKMIFSGASYASLCGSGSAVFGLFKNPVPLIHFPGCFVWKDKL